MLCTNDPKCKTYITNSRILQYICERIILKKDDNLEYPKLKSILVNISNYPLGLDKIIYFMIILSAGDLLYKIFGMDILINVHKLLISKEDLINRKENIEDTND